MACLQLECNQTFLGMVQLQYLPLVDIVRLIDLLEKACIRFVHFSEENELRSRVFSEKMGLESGWNCHISLSGDGDPASSRKTVSYSTTRKRPPRPVKSSRGSLKSRSRGQDGRTVSECERVRLIKSHVGTSLPVLLDRPAWFLDFPKWQEVRRAAANGADDLHHHHDHAGGVHGGGGDDKKDTSAVLVARGRGSILKASPSVETVIEVRRLCQYFYTTCKILKALLDVKNESFWIL